MSQMPPIKNTAGEGFVVEELVGAWLACHMLAGVSWPNPQAGELRTLKFQMRQDGWNFDDLVAGFDRQGESYRFGCSIKSFPVFGPEGAPAELARALWKEWLSDDSPFLRGRDRLAVFTSEHSSDITEAWKGLLDAAHSMEAETIARRMAGKTEPSAARQSAFASIQRQYPVGESGTEKGEETARLLSALSLQEHDFGHLESRSETHAILLCQQALADEARQEAVALWKAIVSFVSEIRKKGGVIDLSKLLDRLAHRFKLKQYPRYAPDWERMRKFCAERLAVVPTKIGGNVELERAATQEGISTSFEAHQGVILLGGSGYGKTVLARMWISAEEGSIPIWVRSADLAVPIGLRSLWNLENSITDLFGNAGKPFRIVLDGLDRCYEEAAFGEAALILLAATNEQVRSRCKVMVTCQPDDWERVMQGLARHGAKIDFDTVTVGEISGDELEQVANRIPSLKPLIHRPHLRPLLCWPKVLDIVAVYWRGDSVSDQWTTETEFAKWFWDAAIVKNQRFSLRARVAQKIAVHTADRLSAGMAIGEFSTDELPALRELQQERHLAVDDYRQVVRFTHDLVADYARLKELQVQSGELVSYLRGRLYSPLWHRSIRLFGLALLEDEASSDGWEKHFHQFDEVSPEDEVAKNLLLEAPIFALRQRAALDRLWPVFAANDGVLLQRFLRQFLRAATVPNENILGYVRENEPDLKLDVAIKHRWPFVPYWPGVLAFLNAHREQAVAFARLEVAKICLLWLPHFRATAVGMSDAADLAVTSATAFYRSGEMRYSRPHEISAEKQVCRALLAASPVAPEKVAKLALKLSGRILPENDDGLPVEPAEPQSRFLRARGAPAPWAEGPKIRPVSVFCEAFMEGENVAPFFRALPNVGAEVMFATLLNIPRENDDIGGFGFDLDEHGFSRQETRTEAVFWTNGPFLTFLHEQPDIGLMALIRLINFGTDRALELPKGDRPALHMTLTIDGESRQWHGHQHTYQWYRGHVFGPWAVSCALMAIERWLYELIDGNQPVDSYLALLLRESRSIAIGAVLVAVGKKKPELFLGVLRPLIAAPDLYFLDTYAVGREGEGCFQSPLYTDPKWLREAWSKWMGLPHRNESLADLVTRIMATSPEWKAAMETIRGEWISLLGLDTTSKSVAERLSTLIDHFDPANGIEQPSDSETPSIASSADQQPISGEERVQHERFEKLRTLPSQCGKILKGEIELSEEQLSRWWDEIPDFVALCGDSGVLGCADALAGIVAVAAVHHRNWLRKEENRERLAGEILSELLSIETDGSFMRYRSPAEERWDNFAAWAITALWVEEPEDKSLRQAVAEFASWGRYAVVERVFRIAADNRKKLGNHFGQLLSFSVEVAQARHREIMEHHRTEKTFDLLEWLQRKIEEFGRGKFPLLPASWATVRDRIPGEFRNGSLSNDFDIGHLNATLAWAEDLDRATSEAERADWIALHHQAIVCAVHRIECWARLEAEQPDVADQQRKNPYDDESRLLDRLARILSRLKPGEDHQSLWEPIFALGADGPNWIQEFFRGWTLESVDRGSLSKALNEQWTGMLEFAESSDSWKKESRDFRGLGDTWATILGLSQFGGFWTAELAPTLLAIQPFLKRWAIPRLNNSYRAKSILRLLQSPAAVHLRLDFLMLFREHISFDDAYYWREAGIQDAFADFIRLLFDEHWPEVSSSETLRAAFMAIVLKLSALQHPLGSELLVLAGQRFGSSPSQTDSRAKSSS